MIPNLIVEYTEKLLDRKTRKETRQFYYATLLAIQKKVDDAIKAYEKE